LKFLCAGGGIIAVLPGQLGIGVFSPHWTNVATACAA
jgi:glutaminase